MKKRKLLSLIQSMLLLFACFPAQIVRAEEESADVDVWDGTVDTSWYDDEETEFHLQTAEQFMGIMKLVIEGKKDFAGKTLYLESDMDLAHIEFKTLGSIKGVFDGQSHEIMNVNTTDGLFYELSKDGIIQNCTFSGQSCLGGICYSNLEMIRNCTFIGYIISDNAKSDHYMGGICYSNGYSWNEMPMGTIEQCSVFAHIICRSNYATILNEIGGICGYNSGSITACSFNGFIWTSFTSSGSCHIGGICGLNEGKITDCFNNASVINTEGNHICGGITGISGDYGSHGSIANVSNVYNSGTIYMDLDVVNPEYTKLGGGIAGQVFIEKNSKVAPFIENAYYLNTTGTLGVYGVKNNSTTIKFSDNTVMKTEANMKTESFAEALGEAFVAVKNDYPALKNVKSYKTGDANGDGAVNSYDVVILQSHLLAEREMSSKEAAFVDQEYGMPCISARDLTLLKRMLIKQ